MSMSEVHQRAKIDLWYVARFLVFWIVGSRSQKPKPIRYYLDIEKLTGQIKEKKQVKISKEEQIKIWKKIDKLKGRKVDYSNYK